MSDVGRVLIVDDDAAIRRVLEVGLTARGFEVTTASTGQDGVSEVALVAPDVVLLDLGLPDIDGVEVCRRVRSFSRVPIIVLSVEGAERRKIEALDDGADDYVTKPFAMGELLARVRAAVRRGAAEDPTAEVADRVVLSAGPLRLDAVAHRVTLDGRQLELTDTEFRILSELLRNVGRVLTHEMLLRAVWGPGYGDEVHYLRVYVNRLRKKLEADPTQPRLLVTVPRVGYRLEAGEH